jgi:hypothetical protein
VRKLHNEENSLEERVSYSLAFAGVNGSKGSNCDTADDSNCETVNCANVRASVQ